MKRQCLNLKNHLRCFSIFSIICFDTFDILTLKPKTKTNFIIRSVQDIPNQLALVLELTVIMTKLNFTYSYEKDNINSNSSKDESKIYKAV